MARIRTIGWLCVVLLVCISAAYGQGGWRQWEIYMRDGTHIVASPLSVNEKGQIAYSMANELVERVKIDYIAILAKDLPAAPEGNFDKDLVVKTDGTRAFGTVMFRGVKFSEGKIIQNGKDIDLKDVAYLKFATPKAKGPSKKSN